MPPILSRRVKSGDAEISYWTLGDGSPIILLHPFPVHHEFWLPVAEALATKYRAILPDLRGHGDSEVGKGPATMRKHADDIARVMDGCSGGCASLIGVSIGGFALFQFRRQRRCRGASLALCNTKA